MPFTFFFLAVASVGWYMTAALPECDVIPVPQDVSANITTCSSGMFSIVISWRWPYDWSTCEETNNQMGIWLRELSTGTSVGIANIPSSSMRATADCSVRNLKCGSFYSVIMSLLGTEEFQMITTVTILGGPSIPTVGEVSEKVIQLSWSPFSPISVCDVQPNVSYTVAYHGRAHCGDETPHNSTAVLQETEYTFEDLEEYTNYTFNLTMYPGGMNIIIHAQTLAAAPTGKPQNVTAKNVTDMTVELIWDREDCFSRNGEITGYVVQYSKDCGSQDVMNKSVGVEEAPSQSFTTDQLSPSTSYMFQVAAVNANETGPFSETFCITTLAGDDKTSSSSLGIVAGAAAAGVILIVVVVVAVVVKVFRRRKNIHGAKQDTTLSLIQKATIISALTNTDETTLDDAAYSTVVNSAYEKVPDYLVTASKDDISTAATNGVPVQNTSDATPDSHINQCYEKVKFSPPTVGPYHKKLQVSEGE